MTTVVAQIEDPEALGQMDAIAEVDGIDALFIGRGDLAVALGVASPEAPEIRVAAERIGTAARRAGKPVMVLSATTRMHSRCAKSAQVHSSSHPIRD